MPAYCTTDYPSDLRARRGEMVFVLHGLGGTRFMTAVLCRRLARQGFDVRNWAYPSWRNSLEAHAGRLRQELSLARQQTAAPVHVVGRSMGAAVARCALVGMDLADWEGRFVMLGPPNHGSPVATFCSRIVGCPAAVQELSSRQGSFVRNLPAGPLPQTGIIAARLDYLIPLRNTRLEGVSEHVVVNTIHKTLPFNREVSRLAGRFLESGTFG